MYGCDQFHFLLLYHVVSDCPPVFLFAYFFDFNQLGGSAAGLRWSGGGALLVTPSLHGSTLLGDAGAAPGGICQLPIGICMLAILSSRNTLSVTIKIGYDYSSDYYYG